MAVKALSKKFKHHVKIIKWVYLSGWLDITSSIDVNQHVDRTSHSTLFECPYSGPALTCKQSIASKKASFCTPKGEFYIRRKSYNCANLNGHSLLLIMYITPLTQEIRQGIPPF